MPKAKSTDLFYLIKSLSPAEKRHFKRHQTNMHGEDQLIIRLFDAIDGLKTYDSVKLNDKLQDLSDRQIINLKRHLQATILKSLRQLQINKRHDIYISEHIDYARILYSKGHYIQSLRILEKLLPLAIQSEEPLLQLEIMEFEKYIEARHITRSRRVKDKMEGLINRSQAMASELNMTVFLSNLSLEVHGYYIQNGFVRNNKDYRRITNYFNNQIAQLPSHSLNFTDAVYLSQSFMWYHYITQNLPGVYRYARQWVNLFRDNPHLIIKDTATYMRGMHYLLLSCFYSNQIHRYKEYLSTFEHFNKTYMKDLEVTSQMLGFVYYYNAQLNAFLLQGRYDKALKLEIKITQGIQKFSSQLDTHRILIFYYKLAYIHFGRQNYDAALEWLNHIIHRKTKYLRPELQLYAQLLHVILHLEKGHYALSKYLLRSLQRTLNQSSLKSTLLELTTNFIKDCISHPSEKQSKALALNNTLHSLDHNSYEWRSLTYFNFLDWSEALVKNCSIEKVVRMRQ